MQELRKDMIAAPLITAPRCKGLMGDLAIFAISALMNLVSSAVIAKLYVWPSSRITDTPEVIPPDWYRQMPLWSIIRPVPGSSANLP